MQENVVDIFIKNWILHNSDPARMGDEGEKTVARRERYQVAMELLLAS